MDDNKHYIIKYSSINLYGVPPLFHDNVDYIECDCYKEKTDIVFIGPFCDYFIKNENNKIDIQETLNYYINKIKGNPILVCLCTDHNHYPYEHNDFGYSNITIYDWIKDKYSVTNFKLNTNNNFFFPYGVEQYLYYIYRKNLNNTSNTSTINKTKFCCLISSNETPERNKIYNILSKYKQVDWYGKGHLELNEEYYYDIISQYKFMLCIENTKSIENEYYITEKIVNAYKTNCVPIHWGCERADELFNKETFINITNYKDENDLINKIRLIDEDDDTYNKMLNNDNVLICGNEINLVKYNEFIFNLLMKNNKYNININHFINKFDKIFIVSFVKNADKRKAISKYLTENLNINNFEFVYGIDPTISNICDINIYDNIYMDEPYVFKDKINNIKKPNYYLHAISCGLAHLSIYQIAISEGYEKILIIEDDAIFIKDKAVIFNYLNNIPENADIIYYGYIYGEDYYKYNNEYNYNELYNIVPKDNIIGGLQCYAILNKNFLYKILDYQKNVFSVADQFLSTLGGNQYIAKEKICYDPEHEFNK